MIERGRADWVDVKMKDQDEVWIYWRSPENWAAMLAAWVEETGQRGTVLTVYELLEGEASKGKEWAGMPREVLLKSLNVLVKRSKANIFGEADQPGVKFYG